jgi:hypothetical protein
MSVEAISWVWKFSRSRLAARLLMLRIANNADENGCNSWHTVPSMARATKLSERQVTRASRTLEALGEITVAFNAGPNGANVYTLVGMGDKLSPPPVTNRTQSGDKSGGVIREGTSRTSKTLTPPSPPLQGGNGSQSLTPNKHQRRNRAERRRDSNLEVNTRVKARLAANLIAPPICAIHPESGLTIWGTCWECYSIRAHERSRPVSEANNA